MKDHITVSDIQLVQKFLNGEESAGKELFEQYSSRVYYLALRELRSHADAEDVRAETFLRVIQSIQGGQLRTPDALSSFVLGIARNVIRETYRAPHRRAQDAEMPDLPAPEPEPMLDEDVRRAIEITIKRLKPREQEFLRLHYYDELSKEEIAHRIGVDEERVRLIKSRSLKSFREMYERVRKFVDTKGGGPSLKV